MSATLLVASTLALTIAAYVLSLAIRRRLPSPLTTPVFFSTAIVIAVLEFAHVTFREYGPAKQILTTFLGPATVALAVPLYKNRTIFARHLAAATFGLVAGALGTMTAAAMLARLLSFPAPLVASLSLKSITVPVAVELAKSVHGDPALVAMFVVCTGMLGASFGPWLLDLAKVEHPVSRGLALGTISHGQGTAQAASENELSGAIAGVAMGLSAVIMSIVAPFAVPVFAR